MIKKETCITKTHKSATDLILTNKPLSFKSSSVIEFGLTLSCGANQWTGFYMITASVMKGLSDHQKLITTFVKHFTRLNQSLFTTETLRTLMEIPS